MAPHSSELHLQQQKVRLLRSLPERDAPSGPNCRRLAPDSFICHLRRLPARRTRRHLLPRRWRGSLRQHHNTQTDKQRPERPAAVRVERFTCREPTTPHMNSLCVWQRAAGAGDAKLELNERK